MKVLQLCSYYIRTPLYKNLVESLDSNLSQYIYVPFQRSKKDLFQNRFSPNLINGLISYRPIWYMYNRVFYKNKLNRAIKDVTLSKQANYNMIHAHTWFSDGGIAYEIYKRHKIPYIVTIRNTDLNFFYKYRIDLRSYGFDILRHASYIVFISHAYRSNVETLFPNHILSQFQNKFRVIPNGIDNFWFNEEYQQQKANRLIKNFIYVGEINRNKNVLNIIKAFNKMKGNPNRGVLSLVGFSSESEFAERVKKECKENKNIVLLPKCSKEELRDHLRSSDIFIMPSFRETFGLVYIEALSQGLPIIYSQNQGVDGYFDKTNVGIKVDPRSVDSITRAMARIINNYDDYQAKTREISKSFQWNKIALKYLELYNNIIK